MEVLLVVTLLSLIVLALMSVFNMTQAAFRASVTQTDVLEGSRAAVDLIARDLRGLTPSGNTNAVNFYTANNDNFFISYQPLYQSLPGSSNLRTNLLQGFFVLGRNNDKWTGAGYVVNSGDTNSFYPLYCYHRSDLSVQSDPRQLFAQFTTVIATGQWTNQYMSHLMDGVVHLVVRAYDTNGYWMTNGYAFGQRLTVTNAWFFPSEWGEVGCDMVGSTVPASVELQLGVLEDSTVQRAESLPNNLPALPPNDRRTQFLYLQSGKVHLFRQRVPIPNLDPTAYQ